MGSTISSYIGNKDDKKYLYNGGYTVGQRTRSNNGNTTNLRTFTDPVSLLSLGSKNMKTVSFGGLNPLLSHNLENLKGKNINL